MNEKYGWYGDEPFVGEIRMFAGTYAPQDWALCHGQMLAIVDNCALYSILGTMYGGDGRVTFRLPDLRGRVPIADGYGGTGISTGNSLWNRPAGGAESAAYAWAKFNQAAEGPTANVMAKPEAASIDTMPPFTCVNFIICLYGQYPNPS